MEAETNGACMALWGAEPAAASLLGSMALCQLLLRFISLMLHFCLRAVQCVVESAGRRGNVSLTVQGGSRSGWGGSPLRAAKSPVRSSREERRRRRRRGENRWRARWRPGGRRGGADLKLDADETRRGGRKEGRKEGDEDDSN